MCIAIYKPAHLEISKETLQNCFDSNKDGAGFAYINIDHKGVKRLKVKKDMTFEGFYKKYEKALSISPDSPFLLHFRIATHGTVDLFNCHPFYINKNLVFIHNGIISKVTKDKNKSDTQMFNEEILQGITQEDLFHNPSIHKLIEDFIGTSKLVLLDIDGNVKLFNERLGNWDNGIWYSNHTWKPKVIKTTVYNSSKTNYSSYKEKFSEKLPAKTVLNENSYVKCSSCNVHHKLTEMTHYSSLGVIVSFCTKCGEKAMEEYFVSDYDNIYPEQYIKINNLQNNYYMVQ